MSRISEDMKELHSITNELKRVNTEAKKLRERKKEIEVKILAYLQEAEQPGLKYHELIVLKHETKTHTRVKKTDKETAAIQILEEAGVNNPKEVYASILESSVGEEIIKPKLKIKETLQEVF